MPIATLLFVTSTLVAPPAPAPVTFSLHTPAKPAASFGQQRATVAPLPGAASPVRRFGLGGSLAVSNYGVNGSMRYWFSRHVGVSMAAGWYRARAYASYYNPLLGQTTRVTPSTVMASPSIMFHLNETDPNRAVSVRPFFGAGVTWARAASYVPLSFAPNTTLSLSGVTSQEFGGVEMFFRDHRNISISLEGVYTRLSSSFVNRSYVNPLTFVVGATFYLK